MITNRLLILTVFLVALAAQGCAMVQSFERDQLGDPLMEREDQFAKQTLEQKFFLSREGSIGGTLGIGGGCGCAK